MCKQCSLGMKNFIVDELLTYVNTYINGCTAMTMKMALLGFYSEEMIHNSKMKVMKLAAETGVDIREVKETRQNTAGRTAREKEVDDILNIMKQIDESEDANVIEFYAKDVKLMPPASPESGSSNMCLLEVVNNQN